MLNHPSQREENKFFVVIQSGNEILTEYMIMSMLDASVLPKGVLMKYPSCWVINLDLCKGIS